MPKSTGCATQGAATLATWAREYSRAGHEDANTTRGYVVAANNLAQEIASKLSVPHFDGGIRSAELRWSDIT